MTNLLIIILAGVPGYVLGFVCGSEWRAKRVEPHLAFLRKTSDEWFERYMVLLREKTARLTDESK